MADLSHPADRLDRQFFAVHGQVEQHKVIAGGGVQLVNARDGSGHAHDGQPRDEVFQATAPDRLVVDDGDRSQRCIDVYHLAPLHGRQAAPRRQLSSIAMTHAAGVSFTAHMGHRRFVHACFLSCG